MLLLGYFLGTTFEGVVTNIDHWIAFILLSIIGIKMVKESFSKETKNYNDDVSVKTMLILSIATSIDALAVGITFALLPDTNIVASVCSIGVITFLFSVIGVKIGNKFGCKFKSKAEIAGGLILCMIGIKILVEHLGIF